MIKPIKIVIVDDHDIVIDGLKSILNPFTYPHRQETKDEIESTSLAKPAYSEKYPFQIVGVAGSGEEMIERIAVLKEVDIVVLDYYMKGMNGLETALELKKRRPGVKVVLFSMEEAAALITEVFACNIEAYVTKGEGRQRLMDAIKKVHAGERVFPSLKSYAGASVPWMMEKNKNTPGNILSKREVEVACLIVNGHTTQQIADALNIAFNTVEVHRSNIYRKLDIKRLAELVRYALENNLCG